MKSLVTVPMTRKTLLAGILMLGAAGVWGWRWIGSDQIKPSQLQQTDGIEASVIAIRPTNGAYVLSVRVSNHTDSLAEHVVLTARLVTRQGRTLAENPLVGLANLASHDERRIEVPLVATNPSADPIGQVDVTLVRWAK